jgi:hypothetical protein
VLRLKDPESFAIPEPRIRHVAHELARLLSLVELEYQGRPVSVDGFRLRNLERWVQHSTNTAMNALTPISSVCNSRCQFCFEENVPYAREQSLMSLAEAATRLKYYSPDTGRCLFPSNRNHMETFIHPHAVDIIEMARRREPDKLFWITTNGSHFTEEVVARLATLKPLIFKLSLNASDPALNRDLMKTGKRTETALAAPRLLQKYRIPFMGGIVAWPTLPLASIEETVRYLERFQAYAIRIRLPLAHRWLKHQLDVDFHAHWKAVGALAQELRRSTTVPLFVEPPVYWVNPIIPEVDGVVQNSPAHRAGLRACDIVRSVNGTAVRTRIDSEAMLDQCHVRREPVVRLLVERDGTTFETALREEEGPTDTYPYNAAYFYRGENYGIFHVEDFRLRYIQQVIDLIRQYGAREVLLFSSAAVAPLFTTLAELVPEFRAALADVTLRVAVVEDNAFGGNYDVMDSRVVADYASVIRQRLRDGEPIDLVLIPDAFGSGWGTDVFGASDVDLMDEFGIPVERIEWHLVYGREV